MEEKNIPPRQDAESTSGSACSNADSQGQDINHNAAEDNAGNKQTQPEKVPEIGGPKGPEPTRYGDWEQNGRCTDF